jgi:glyoxylase-like metal-dependent hydrolase (beta-lactamase superfamily II)/8-oxo-dGTP pyrophosphatase MutT (NUDIX family)
VLVRDGAGGLEVLLMRRDDRGDPSGGAWVFPGGLVDAGDAECRPLCVGVDDVGTSARLELVDGGLDYLVAAVRECFEECGLLLASGRDGEPVAPAVAETLQDWRVPLNEGTRTLADLCRDHELRLAAGDLAYVSHWVTPVGYKKRFDVRFFVAAAPAGQVVHPDGTEVLEHRWLRPVDALAQEPPLKLMNPTRKTLAAIAPHRSVADVMAWARGLQHFPRIQPHLGIDVRGPRPVNPDEAAYAEIRHLDPLGEAPARCHIEAGAAVRLSPRVIRVTAPNGGMMTGPGTNTYLVGPGPGAAHAADANADADADADVGADADADADAGAWAVIDPGPADPAHVSAILAAAPGPIRWILVTHTHLDHSPAALALREATGAAVWGRRPDHTHGQDGTFAPDRVLAGGERLALAPGTTLRAIHTPGHASNHLCYLLEEERTLFTGDHVMQGSTVVIAPPDGDMAAYLGSLRSLLHDEVAAIDWLAPGHGFLIAEPARAMQALVDHRLKRERKVLAALQAHDGATADVLLAHVYDDVPVALHRPALRSLNAHLQKLEQDGTARHVEGRWFAIHTRTDA